MCKRNIEELGFGFKIGGPGKILDFAGMEY